MVINIAKQILDPPTLLTLTYLKSKEVEKPFNPKAKVWRIKDLCQPYFRLKLHIPLMCRIDFIGSTTPWIVHASKT